MIDCISEHKGHHIADRVSCYPQIAEQLDKLWHDIHSGLFGEPAKTGSFYLTIKAVKDEFPKSE
jgi:hypothetical protein